MHANTVSVYKLVGNRLVNANLDQIIINNLIPGQDMANFYLWTADPFAIIKNGKTYLRFMNYPGEGMDYDKKKLLLCTYLWQGKRIALTGPNLGFTGPNASLAEAKNCIGSREASEENSYNKHGN